jgi:putative hemolysin
VLLLLLSAFFSGSETAFFSLSRARTEALRRSSSRSEQGVADLISKPVGLLVTILFGNMLVNIAAASLWTMLALREFGEEFFELSALAMTFFLLIFGEVTPKSLAAYRPLAMAKRSTKPLKLLYKLLYPIRRPLTRLSSALVRSIGKHSSPEEALTAEELRTALTLAREQGVIDEVESSMVERILILEERLARQMMTPISEVVSLPVNTPPAEALGVFRRHQYARLPIRTGDGTEWLGLVRARDIAQAVIIGPATNLRPYLLPLHHVPESANALALLRHFNSTGSHLALVNDEYGVLAGLVTLQDIHGELYDTANSGVRKLRRLEPGVFVCESSLGLDDFNRNLGTNIQDPHYNSIGGYLTGLLGRIPQPGERLSAAGYSFTVLEATSTKIVRLLARREGDE